MGNFLFKTVSEKKFAPKPPQAHRNNGSSVLFSSRHASRHPDTYVGELFQNSSGSPHPTNCPPLSPQEQKIKIFFLQIHIYIV